MAQEKTISTPTSAGPAERMGFRAFIEQVREDFRAHHRDWTLPGFRAVAVHRFGVWVSGLHPRLVRAPFSFVYNSLYRYVRNHYSIELPRTVKVGRRLRIGHQGGIVIHYLVKIGDDCLIRQNVTIGALSEAKLHDVPVLGNRVDIGCGAVILGGVRIGDEVRIGANTVVRTDVPAGSTVLPATPQMVVGRDSWSYSI